MSRYYLAAFATLLILGSGGPSAAQSVPGARGAKPAATTHRIDILRWPAYQGTTLLQQVSMSAREIQELAKELPAEARAALRGIKNVAVAEYRLPSGVVLRSLVAFHEPRVLAAGYKILMRDFSEPDEVSAIYTGPNEHALVLTAERDREGGGTMEIVAVQGPLSSLVAVGDVMKKVGERAAKNAAKSPTGAK